MIIQGIVEIQSALGQKLKNSQQNGLLENKSQNSKRPKKLGLKKLSTEKLIHQRNIKA